MTAKGARAKTLKSDFLVDSDLEEHCKWLESFQHKIDFLFECGNFTPTASWKLVRWIDTRLGGYLKGKLIAPSAILRSQSEVFGFVRKWAREMLFNDELYQ